MERRSPRASEEEAWKLKHDELADQLSRTKFLLEQRTAEFHRREKMLTLRLATSESHVENARSVSMGRVRELFDKLNGALDDLKVAGGTIDTQRRSLLRGVLDMMTLQSGDAQILNRTHREWQARHQMTVDEMDELRVAHKALTDKLKRTREKKTRLKSVLHPEDGEDLVSKYNRARRQLAALRIENERMLAGDMPQNGAAQSYSGSPVSSASSQQRGKYFGASFNTNLKSYPRAERRERKTTVRTLHAPEQVDARELARRMVGPGELPPEHEKTMVGLISHMLTAERKLSEGKS